MGLKYLNAIREFDEINGEVVIEPGCTQGQLAQFLKDKNAKFWADVTGATPEASLIGNTLEAGFGHTPIGDHRKHILQVEVMLADGTTLTTSEMPAVGPDLSQLFVQSNFGIVTSMRIPLFPIPEKTLSFTISFASPDAFFKGVSILKALRKDGTISSLVHTANATRTLMTSSRFPQEYDRSQVLSGEDCLKILNHKSPISFGAWSTLGGLYGYKEDVKNKQKRIEKALKSVAKVKFFSDEKMNVLESLLYSKLAKKLSALDFIRRSFSSFKALHNILRGQPSRHPSENIFWRVDKVQDLGLMWHAPVIPATEKDCRRLVETAQKIYSKYRMEMPITLTLVSPKYMTSVFNISFNKSDLEETRNAHAAYQELVAATKALGYSTYRSGIASSPPYPANSNQLVFLKKIKDALDPVGILAPGRYGLGSHPKIEN